jgi:hypothetical protein
MFRAGGIYILPNGRELMAAGDETNFYAASDNGDLLRYELNENGRLLYQGRLTAWSAEDLRDSTQTAELPLTAQVGQSSETTGT